MRGTGSFTLATDRHGSLVVRGEALVDGQRRTRQKKVSTKALGERLVHALKAAAIDGDYDWLLSREWDPTRYLKVPTDGSPAKPARRRAPRRKGATTISDFAPRYLELVRNGDNKRRTVATIDAEVKAVVDALGDRPLESFRTGELRQLRGVLDGRLDEDGQLIPETKVAPRSIINRMNRLKDILRQAVGAGELVAAPSILLDGIPRKLAQQSQRVKRGQSPLSLDEMQRILPELQKPTTDREVVGFAMTDFCFRGGFRWGEVAGARYDTSFRRDGAILISESWDSVERVQDGTKTMNSWWATLTTPMQAALNIVEPITKPSKGYVFSITGGRTPLEYKQWRKCMIDVMERADVRWRDGLAQKLFRKSFVTWSAVCGVPAKLVSSHYGHLSTMTIQNEYDLAVQAISWPSPADVKKLRAIYAFDELERVDG